MEKFRRERVISASDNKKYARHRGRKPIKLCRVAILGVTSKGKPVDSRFGPRLGPDGMTTAVEDGTKSEIFELCCLLPVSAASDISFTYLVGIQHHGRGKSP